MGECHPSGGVGLGGGLSPKNDQLLPYHKNYQYIRTHFKEAAEL